MVGCVPMTGSTEVDTFIITEKRPGGWALPLRMDNSKELVLSGLKIILSSRQRRIYRFGQSFSS